ncbi:uncharacterized protein BX664DRAFT_352476 [Halteromyces radiatus]|uniref:uncharacterized protein n=1 Tax=Halteromyces radiatus TaxID=101107 RepID=UPI00221FD4B6|nr:uncharacterized protein BX664DRAFT_352476 [Halteromyces radiatus]KAI8081319.1 hypothetical protein BX664DRAFT_352476 [Halteromyces radiatus]
MSDGRCIHCGQKGHYSMMCPKKPNSVSFMNYDTTCIEYSNYQSNTNNNNNILSFKIGKKRRFSLGFI